MIRLIRGDITSLEVDAIVNAANNSLLGGGGVDGAIHRAAGPQLLEECRTLNGCPTGEARITRGYDLTARYVIHTVGPVWHGGNRNEDVMLKSCYLNMWMLEKEYELSRVAFPNQSTGGYRFPKELAARIAIAAVHEHLSVNKFPFEVLFVCFDHENHSIYSSLLGD